MDAIFDNKMFCYNMTDSKDRYVEEWANNGTTDTIIEFDMAPGAPHLFFTPWNTTYYQWCGPSILLPQYFANLTKTK